MEYYKHPPEYAPLPSELELRPGLELAAPPPEFGQGTTMPAETTKAKRRLRQFLAVPALLLVSFLCLHGVKLPPTTEVEAAEPIQTYPTGSVVFDVLYAVRDVDTVRYSYVVYSPGPSMDAPQELIDAYHGTPYPISVYARLSDEAGHLVAPADDPDVWEGSRSWFESTMDASGLEGSLTLTLTAVYTEEGEERQTEVVLPLTELPPAAETFATLNVVSSGAIDYYAGFNPQPGDDHDYRFRASEFRFIWLDENDEVCTKSFVLNYDTLPSINGNSAVSEKAIAAAYAGPADLERPVPQARSFVARLILTDETTGYRYTIDSNRVEASSEPILEGELYVYPGGDVDAYFRVRPVPGDSREYDLYVVQMGQMAYDGEETMGFSLVDDPGSMPVTGDSESGFEVHYSGSSAASMIPQGTQLSLYAVFEDANTGTRYTVETNRIDAVERILPYETYPLGDGKLTITVYNDTLIYDIPSTIETESYVTILALDTMPESEFESYALPSAWGLDGYEFGGWVVHVNNPMDLSAGGDVFSEYGGDPPPEALLGEDSFVFRIYGTLTRDDIERVPPSDDGVRYVNVHAVWIQRETDNPLLFLDDGAGNITGYGMESPIASEGYLYLCNYPAPNSAGREFDGWYDANGNRVDLLCSFFSFSPVLRNPDGSFAGYDWTNYEPIYLTAHWK